MLISFALLRCAIGVGECSRTRSEDGTTSVFRQSSFLIVLRTAAAESAESAETATEWLRVSERLRAQRAEIL